MKGESKGVNKTLLKSVTVFYIQSGTHNLGFEKTREGKRERQEDAEDLRAEENVIY